MKKPANEEVLPASASVGSFESFFAAEHIRLQRALYVVMGRDEEARDVSQEAFLKVWEKWDRVGQMESPAGYLYRTAMNIVRSRLRRAARAAAHFPLVRPRQREFAEVEDRTGLIEALAGLTARQRAAIVLMDLLDFGSEEASELLGVRPSTVRNLAAQGRRALERALETGDE